MQQVLPNNLNYNEIKPVGYPSHVRQEKYTPVAFNQSTTGVQGSDVIRFNISTNGFWDPYSAYIKIEVDVTGMDGTRNATTGSGSLQVDNSASSFINQLIVYKGGTEIERIEEYDTIAAILNDVNCSFDNRQTRLHEGMYAQQVSGAQQYQNPCFLVSQNTTQKNLIGYSPLMGINLINNLTDTSLATQINATFNSASSIQRYEYALLNFDGKAAIQDNSAKYPILNGQTNYELRRFGWNIPFNSSLSSLGNEALLSKNINTTTIYHGRLNQSTIPSRQTFCIPLISGLLGVLMPKESYKYIPMKALQELILEFRLSPYAMFSSGYNDGAINSSNLGTSAQAAMTTFNLVNRIWRITRFELNVEMQYFEPQIENIILSQLSTDKGIVIHSCSWMLGPRYQFAGNQAPNGTYQVNLGFESLKNVVFVFLPDEFQTYPFCRKQYRLSANITSLYLKIGNEFYPPLPLTGHAGNCLTYTGELNETDQNNSEFLISLYKTFGKFHDISNNCIINSVNFAVNNRVYNPTNTTALTTLGTDAATTFYNNLDTPMSLPLFHENRCVGRAVYAMNLETLNNDYNVISGINTIQNRPFEITLKADTDGAFSRAYTMYVFCQYDMLIQLRTTGVQVLGRG